MVTGQHGSINRTWLTAHCVSQKQHLKRVAPNGSTHCRVRHCKELANTTMNLNWFKLFLRDELDDHVSEIFDPEKSKTRQLLRICVPCESLEMSQVNELAGRLKNLINETIGKSTRKDYQRPSVANVSCLPWEIQLSLFGYQVERIRKRIAPALEKVCPRGTYFGESSYQTNQPASYIPLFKGDNFAEWRKPRQSENSNHDPT